MSDDAETERDPALERLEKIEAPLRSEQAAFRFFVAVAVAAAPIILAGLLISSLAALIVLLFEVGVGIGVAVSRRRSRSRAGT